MSDINQIVLEAVSAYDKIGPEHLSDDYLRQVADRKLFNSRSIHHAIGGAALGGVAGKFSGSKSYKRAAGGALIGATANVGLGAIDHYRAKKKAEKELERRKNYKG